MGKMYPKLFAKFHSVGQNKVLEELHQKCEDVTMWGLALKKGENLVRQKVQADLQFKIESLHYSILQLTTNIAKLTGEITWFIFSCICCSLG